MKSTRISEEELKQIQEENARKLEEESQQRKERAKQKLEEMKQRELDEAAPKARSALAARWEEKIKSRTGGKVSTTENRTTVMSDVSLQPIPATCHKPTKSLEHVLWPHPPLCS